MQGVFHGGCVDLSLDDIDFRTTENPTWRCKSCQVLRRKSLQVESAIETTTNEDMVKFLREIEGGNENSDNIIGKGAWKTC